jgi:hypothetical protein
VYRTDIEDNFGELLPHLMMADITRWMGALVGRTEDDEHASPADRELLQTVVAFLEELIAVSFLENLGQTGEQCAVVKNLLGPSLRSSLDQMDSSLSARPCPWS